MLVIILIRIAIWATFLFLIIEGIAVTVFIPKAVRVYLRNHRVLEARVERIERRLQLTEE